MTGFLFISGEKIFIRMGVKLASGKILRFAQIIFISSFLLPLGLKVIPSSGLSGTQSSVFQVYAEDLSSQQPLVKAKVKTVRLVKSTREDLRTFAPEISSRKVFFLLWCFGVAFAACFFFRNLLRVRWSLKSSSILRKHKNLYLAVNANVYVPFSVQFGFSKWIVLPAHLLENKKDLNLAIKHELQHHRQGDCAWAMALEFSGLFFFFNPAFSWWKNIIMEQQEFSCDEALTGQSGFSSQDYGSCLLRVAETALIHRQLHVGTTSMAAIIKDSNYFKKFLMRRIEMITEEKGPKRSWLASLMAFSLATITAGVAIGAEKLVRAEQSKINEGKVSVDRDVQKIADDILTRALLRTKATAGFILVADPSTGRILAVANMDKVNKRPPQWALSELMESASIAKPLMVSKAFELQATAPDELLNCENGKYVYNGTEYRDWKDGGWKKLTTAQAMELSSNICAIKIAEKVGEKELMKMLEDFGFGAGGSAKDFPQSRVGERPAPGPQLIPQVSIGFGFKSTPLEVLQAYGAIANGGELMSPIMTDSKKVKPLRRILSASTSEKVRNLLADVVRNGTGKRAQSDLYTTAGKTASARFNNVMNHGVKDGKNLANYAGFIGFAPVSHPEIEVYVGLIGANTDGSGSHGGWHAAPVFKEVVENVLTHLKVQSDKI